MTENPTILSPSGPSQPPSLANSTTTPEDVEDPSGEIDCICEISEDDGFTICCDKCDTWQHLVCVQLTDENLPAEYYCPKCSPRPLDVSKAKEIQRHRREELAKRSHKRKKPAATSHKKKEHTNGSNGNVPGRVSATMEKTTVVGYGKLPSPKEMHQPPSRKRGYRTLLGTNTTGPHPSFQSPAVGSVGFSNNNVTALSSIPFSTQGGETGNGTGYDKSDKRYKQDFIDISSDPDQYTSQPVQTFIENLASWDPEHPALQGELRMHYSHEKFASIDLPKTSVRQLPGSSKPYSGSEHPRWSFVLETSVSPGELVTIYKGEVVLTKSRQNEPKPQHDVLRSPKLYVLFHPSLPIYIDARKWGSEARFIRRSCRPNLEIRTVVVDHSQVCFGLFAKNAIKAGTQLTLSWDWGETSEAYGLAQEGFDWNLVRVETHKELADRTTELTEQVGDCQCPVGHDCSLAKIRSGVSALKPPFTNGARRKQPIKRNPSIEPSMPIPSKETSPERNPGLQNDDDEDDNRSISAPSSRSKPRSRDLTPSTFPDMAVDMGEMTGREARKFKDVLSRIEKQQQEEQLPQSVKRRKRNSTVSLPTGALALPSPGVELKDGMKGVDTGKRQRLPTHQRSPYSPPVTTPGSLSIPGEYTVTDASVGRRESDSPVHSETGKPRRRASASPVGRQSNGGGSVKHRSKTIVKPPRPQYVNASVQTDDIEDETPWWQQDPKTSPPRPPRLPLRKRLMQSLLRDREEAVATSTDEKKRKHDDTTPRSPESSPAPKSVKLSSGEGVPVHNTPTTDIKQSAETESIALRWVAASSVKSEAQDSATQASTNHISDPGITKPLPLHRPPGPSLADIFADSDLSASHQVQGAPAPLKSPSEPSQGPTSNNQAHVNGFRSSGLHVQLPSGLLPNALTTPSVQSAATSNVIVQSPLSVVPNLANSNSLLNNSLLQPSPTRTKKLSLQDYGKRKQKVETVDKIEERFGMKFGSDGVAISADSEKVSEETRELVDSSPALITVVSLSSTGVPSHSMVLDSTGVPTGHGTSDS